MSKKTDKEVAITVRLPQSIKDKAVSDARSQDLSLSQWVRRLIREGGKK